MVRTVAVHSAMSSVHFGCLSAIPVYSIQKFQQHDVGLVWMQADVGSAAAACQAVPVLRLPSATLPRAA